MGFLIAVVLPFAFAAGLMIWLAIDPLDGANEQFEVE